MGMKWYGDTVVPRVLGDVSDRLEVAGIETKEYIKDRLARRQPTRGAGSRKRGLDPSGPGEYPKVVTADLLKGVNMEMGEGGTVSRVGTNVPHGRHLELGTQKMRRRPWLSRGIAEMTMRIRQILGTEYKG